MELDQTLPSAPKPLELYPTTNIQDVTLVGITVLRMKLHGSMAHWLAFPNTLGLLAQGWQREKPEVPKSKGSPVS